MGRPGAALLYKAGAGSSSTAMKRASTTFSSSPHVAKLYRTARVSTFPFLFPLIAVAHTATSSHVSPGADSYVIEYEKIDVPDSYRGPGLSFPLNIAHAKALLNALKNRQVHCNYFLFVCFSCLTSLSTWSSPVT